MATRLLRIAWGGVWRLAIAALFVWGLGRVFPELALAARLLIGMLVYAVYMESVREASAEELLEGEMEAKAGAEVDAASAEPDDKKTPGPPRV
jgi:hypothetical protein